MARLQINVSSYIKYMLMNMFTSPWDFWTNNSNKIHKVYYRKSKLLKIKQSTKDPY